MNLGSSFDIAVVVDTMDILYRLAEFLWLGKISSRSLVTSGQMKSLVWVLSTQFLFEKIEVCSFLGIVLVEYWEICAPTGTMWGRPLAVKMFSTLYQL